MITGSITRVILITRVNISKERTGREMTIAHLDPPHDWYTPASSNHNSNCTQSWVAPHGAIAALGRSSFSVVVRLGIRRW